MCLAVRYDANGNLPKPIRAKKDIHVIKALDIAEYVTPARFFSAFRHAEYVLNQLVETDQLGITQSTQSHNGTEGKVSQGLHTFGSFAAYQKAFAAYQKATAKMPSSRMVPFHAVIPAGSLYLKGVFEGTQNCYVSTQLMVTGRVEGY